MAEHGTITRYTHGACRCEPCREAGKLYRLRAHRDQGLPDPTPPERGHGTASRYRKGCRCADCRTAQAAYARELRRRQSNRLEVECWCGAYILEVPAEWVREGRTGSCGGHGCSEDGK